MFQTSLTFHPLFGTVMPCQHLLGLKSAVTPVTLHGQTKEVWQAPAVLPHDTPAEEAAKGPCFGGFDMDFEWKSWFKYV